MIFGCSAAHKPAFQRRFGVRPTGTLAGLLTAMRLMAVVFNRYLLMRSVLAAGAAITSELRAKSVARFAVD